MLSSWVATQEMCKTSSSQLKGRSDRWSKGWMGPGGRLRAARLLHSERKQEEWEQEKRTQKNPERTKKDLSLSGKLPEKTGLGKEPREGTEGAYDRWGTFSHLIDKMLQYLCGLQHTGSNFSSSLDYLFWSYMEWAEKIATLRFIQLVTSLFATSCLHFCILCYCSASSEDATFVAKVFLRCFDNHIKNISVNVPWTIPDSESINILTLFCVGREN